jgi:hypothetical protein
MNSTGGSVFLQTSGILSTETYVHSVYVINGTETECHKV